MLFLLGSKVHEEFRDNALHSITHLGVSRSLETLSAWGKNRGGETKRGTHKPWWIFSVNVFDCAFLSVSCLHGSFRSLTSKSVKCFSDTSFLWKELGQSLLLSVQFLCPRFCEQFYLLCPKIQPECCCIKHA